MSRRCSTTIRDARWSTGVQSLEQRSSAKIKEKRHSEVDGASSWSLEEKRSKEEAKVVQQNEDEECAVFCCSCEKRVDGERVLLIEHYSSGWHRTNVRRMLRSNQPISEEDWKCRVDDSEDVGGERGDVSDSSSDSDCTECTDERTTFGLGAARAYIVHAGSLFSVYSALLRDGEASVPDTRAFFTRPLDCTIILLAGGHFAAGVFENDHLVVHRTIRRYVVRAKQGGAQAAIDKTTGSSKSAGANLRRYNAKRMREEIREVLGRKWRAYLAVTPLIFIRCASYQRCIFISAANDDAPLTKGDARLRTIPFETKRPLVDELTRTWERLGEVHDHGPVQEFEQELELRRRERRALRSSGGAGGNRKISLWLRTEEMHKYASHVKCVEMNDKLIKTDNCRK